MLLPHLRSIMLLPQTKKLLPLPPLALLRPLLSPSLLSLPHLLCMCGPHCTSICHVIIDLHSHLHMFMP